jgi:hypothetical protein
MAVMDVMRRALGVALVSIAAIACKKQMERPLQQIVLTTPCDAALKADAGYEVRLFILGIGFPPATSVFESTDVSRMCGGFTAFQDLSSASGLASLRTEVIRLPEQQSLPGFSIANGAPCPFQYTDETLRNIVQRSSPSFAATHFAVVVGPNFGKFLSDGCTADGRVIFLPSNTDTGTIVHEMGHAFAGLDDEYGGGGTYRSTAFTTRNCSTVKTTFASVPGSNPREGCAYFDFGVYRPFDFCRMRDSSSDPFDVVCSKYIRDALQANVKIREMPPSEAPEAPWRVARTATKGLVVTATLTQHEIRVARVLPAHSEDLLPAVVTGDWFVAAFDRGAILGVAPLPFIAGETFPQGRSYPVGKQNHEVAYDPGVRLVRLVLLGLDEQSIAGRDLELRLVHVNDARRDFILSNHLAEDIAAPAFVTVRYGLQRALESYLAH